MPVILALSSQTQRLQFHSCQLSVASVEQQSASSGKKQEEFLVHWHETCSLLKNQETVGVEAMWKTVTFWGVLKLVGRERPWHAAYFYPVCFLAWPSLSILAFPHPHSWACKPSHLHAPDSLPVCLSQHHFCRLYLCIWVLIFAAPLSGDSKMELREECGSVGPFPISLSIFNGRQNTKHNTLKSNITSLLLTPEWYLMWIWAHWMMFNHGPEWGNGWSGWCLAGCCTVTFRHYKQRHIQTISGASEAAHWNLNRLFGRKKFSSLIVMLSES